MSSVFFLFSIFHGIYTHDFAKATVKIADIIKSTASGNLCYLLLAVAKQLCCLDDAKPVQILKRSIACQRLEAVTEMALAVIGPGSHIAKCQSLHVMLIHLIKTFLDARLQKIRGFPVPVPQPHQMMIVQLLKADQQLPCKPQLIGFNRSIRIMTDSRKCL